MDIQQIKYYLALVSEMSFTDAAQDMYISQSSLSKQIRALEKELNVTLLDRSTRKIALTQAGKDFEVYATQMLRIYDQMLANMQKYSPDAKKSIVLTASQVLSYYGLTDIIMSYCDQNKGQELVVSELEPERAIREIRSGSCDLGILHHEYIRDEEFDYIPICHDTIIVVTGRRHPLAGERVLSPTQLSNETFLFIRINDLDNREIMALCARHGFVPNISPSNLRLNSMEKYLLRGDCIALMPAELTRSFHHPDIRRIKLQDPIPRTLGFVVHKARRTAQIEGFMQYILEHYPKRP